MSKLTKAILKMMPQGVQQAYQQKKNSEILAKWERQGKPSPPPHLVKQQTIIEFKDRFQYDTLVETGTWRGDMIDAQLHNFKKIYSIELGQDLWAKAKERFRQYPHVTLLQGDSGVVLKSLVPQLDKPSIFWLDGHYSAGETAKGEKECPIYEELTAIFTSPHNHILLIDDARCFVGANDYPTVEELSAFILNHKPGSDIDVKNDTIRVVCK